MPPSHPLQRLPSPSRGASALLHICGLASYAHQPLVEHPNVMNESYGWHFQYLTIIALSFATATFALGLLADVTLSPVLFFAKNAFAVVSAPIEVLVSLLYWGLRAIDARLVIPEWAPPLETSADLTFHLIPSILLVIDVLLFSPPKANITLWPALAISATISALYWAWVEACYAQNGFYPYPIFEQLSHTGRGALFTGAGFVMAGTTLALGFIYAALNGKEMVESAKKNL